MSNTKQYTETTQFHLSFLDFFVVYAKKELIGGKIKGHMVLELYEHHMDILYPSKPTAVYDA